MQRQQTEESRYGGYGVEGTIESGGSGTHCHQSHGQSEEVGSCYAEKGLQ